MKVSEQKIDKIRSDKDEKNVRSLSTSLDLQSGIFHGIFIEKPLIRPDRVRERKKEREKEKDR